MRESLAKRSQGGRCESKSTWCDFFFVTVFKGPFGELKRTKVMRGVFLRCDRYYVLTLPISWLGASLKGAFAGAAVFAI